jgi:hypothetical protein
MSHWHPIRPNQQFSALSILALLLAITPPALAAPRSTAKMAMQSAPICFIERSGQSAINLDRLCGKGTKRPKANPNGVIDLSIDVNRDGISDQFLDAAQENLEAQEKAEKEYQAKVKRAISSGSSDGDLSRISQEADAISQKIGRDLTQRFPYSSQFKQLAAEGDRLSAQFNALPQSDAKGRAALEARLGQNDQQISREPSYIRVREAERKVYQEIQRRGSAPWLYGPSQN